MNGHESTPSPEEGPPTKPAVSGGPPDPPPRPPKLTARDLLEPGDSSPRIFVAQYIEINELAALLQVKPFKVVANLLKQRVFKDANDMIDFSTAAAIAKDHGFLAEKLF